MFSASDVGPAAVTVIAYSGPQIGFYPNRPAVHCPSDYS